ncbi:MAG: hypothetical protein HGA61_00685 [Candidatus Moranbacteria bacterium]|nr:hypothetical protein [Candidatus Moranbacteria bacterium]
MNYQPKKYTDKELLILFPEAIGIIPEKIKECKSAIAEKEKAITKLLRNVHASETDEFSQWFAEEIIKMLMMPELSALEKNLFRLNNLQNLIKPNKRKNTREKLSEKIEIAKQYPIEELARNKLNIKKSGNTFSALCPLHNEKTPSFYIYPASNRYYCFGCQAKGDVITLTMALYGLDFKEAVALLQY